MSRIQKCRDLILELGLDGIIITNPENRRYLSGFTGSAGVLLISGTQAFLVTDFRYWEQAGQELARAGQGFELIKQGPDLWRSIADLIGSLGWRRTGFEAESITYSEYQKLEKMTTDWLLIPTSGLVEKLRSAKEPEEIESLARAAEITDQAWRETLKIIKPGVREQEIALEFDYQLRVNGAEGSAFTTIVASGPRAALCHGLASEKPVQSGELLIIDGGALYQGYHADMTRTVALGKASPEQVKVYQIVLKAQQMALAILKAGLTGNQVDQVAREYISSEGYGANFGHGLGHSVGLKVHEQPRLAATDSSTLPAGAVVTVEPGVYLPGWGGVRIEDLVVVENEGIRNLTGSPKQDLIEL
ncbi:MAG: Xaa-Pro peptidase family protein [Firmicutes bacterium]|nr:Xaa-Pro peptidase family protein [Bacillota bacterium]